MEINHFFLVKDEAARDGGERDSNSDALNTDNKRNTGDAYLYTCRRQDDVGSETEDPSCLWVLIFCG
ncbi:hypothetical protein TSUD_204810 [Trifolium subterraneum]|uniref:Uncharacterized protein n=1 Tax=Trifolium subterraneum TaxID=3900 RepID=A0A2Z6NH30_TRISU|nr:hypothetical protein TSUD_204810 [Trifolium subterraneum]